MQDSEATIRKIHHYDNALRVFGLSVLLVLVILNIISLQRINQLATTNAKNIIAHSHQIETLNTAGSEQLRQAALANRARLDVDLCIVSVPPQTRTPEYVLSCYEQVEKQLNVKIQRFGYGSH